jgi:hypothetical protein
MRKTRTGPVAGLVVALALSAAPAMAADRIVQGVDWDAVPWATFCPSVRPVPLRTGAGDCPVSHPASARHARWDGFGLGVDEPKANCTRLEQEYRRLTSPKLIGGKPSSNVAVTWGYCMAAFAETLEQRSASPARFSEPLDQWRKRYFGPWLIRAAR